MPSAAIYRRRKDAGLCVGCGRANATPEFVRCPECREDHQESAQVCRSNGICVECRKEDALPGRLKCAGCARKGSERDASRRASRIAAGLCVRCGTVRVDANESKCPDCKRDHARHCRESYWFNRSFGRDQQWLRRLNNANAKQ